MLVDCISVASPSCENVTDVFSCDPGGVEYNQHQWPLVDSLFPYSRSLPRGAGHVGKEPGAVALGDARPHETVLRRVHGGPIGGPLHGNAPLALGGHHWVG